MFMSYAVERADAGVLIAKVTFRAGVVRMVFDPARAGVSRELFDSVNDYPNLANFIATPVAFRDE